MATRIPITKPWFDEEEEKAVAQALRSGWVVQGPNVKEFESKFAKFTGATRAVAVTSCTTALHLSLIACGVKRGDEVVVPSFTFIASANAVQYMGGMPVFADINLDTFNLDPKELEKKITSKTTAIMPVHLFGLSAEMDSVMKIANGKGLKVVEDAACGVGGTYKGKHVGTIGDFGCFSFHPRKSISTGEGGMITTNNENGATLVARLRDHGAQMSDLARHSGGAYLLPDFHELGYNYRMTDIQGAVGNKQMDKLEKILDRKREIAKMYYDILPKIPGIVPPKVPEGCVHGYQAFVCRIVPKDGAKIGTDNIESLNKTRNGLIQYLQDNGIATRQGTHCVHTLTYYKNKYGYKPFDFPNSFIADQTTIALPQYYQMKASEVEEVCEHLRKFLSK